MKGEIDTLLITLQAIGLALSLRRLDLIEMLFLSSRSPEQGTSKSTRPAHDESLLRYVLGEVVSGSSGSDAMSPDFRQSVSVTTLTSMSRGANTNRAAVWYPARSLPP